VIPGSSQEGVPVLFYGHTHGEFAAFSNFYPAVLTVDFITFACSEQAFMYGKSKDSGYRKKVLATPDPYQVKKLGRSVRLRPHWDDMKYDWMCVVLQAKFGQNEDLKELLLSTGDRPIHEDCRDPWWGGGPNHPRGRDLLGKALVRTRRFLRDAG